MKNLATIQNLTNVRKHPQADRLFIGNVNEYQVVTATNLEENSKVVYFALDSILPELPIFEFMRRNKFRVSMVRLRGEVSNGLIIPISEFPELSKDLDVGTDVTKKLGVKKYSKPVPANLAGTVVGQFPTEFVSKTDEDRLEAYPDIFKELQQKEIFITLKIDGSSATFIKDKGTLRVCTRNLELKEDPNNTIWKLAYKYNLKEVIPDGYCIQGEVYGEGIQKNPLGIKGQDLAVFNITTHPNRVTPNLDEFLKLSANWKIPTVPIIYRGPCKWNSIQEMKLEANKSVYPNGSIAEGWVIRPVEPYFSPSLGKNVSVKIISEEYKD